MTHRRLMVPVLASLMVLAAACSKDPPPPVMPEGPTEAELAQMRQDSLDRARADSIAAARAQAEADRAAAAAEAEAARRMAAARETLEAMIFFDYDEAEITSAAEQILRQKVDILRNSPAVRIRIEGHADERGSNEYNIALSNRRAESVREFLAGFGIDANRMSIIPFGEDRPLVNASNEQAWSRNRRAEFSITAGANQINPGM